MSGKEMLTVGVEAPDFTLLDDEANTVTLSSFRGIKHVVLVFYPGDNTPGCTKQLCAIRDEFRSFQEAGTVVFGVNPQSAESHRGFRKKQKYPFPLLVDEDKKVLKAYGCVGALWTTRTVYVIDRNGRVAFAERGTPSNQVILDAIRSSQ